MKIKYPIIVGSTAGGLFLFESLQDMMAKLEPMEVINGDFIAYDGDGRSLCLLTTKQEGEPGYGRVGEDTIRVEQTEKIPSDENSVCNLFLDYFDRADLGGVINREASLEDLLKLFVLSYGYTR